ncbi:MAG TPA: methyltransferase domain-containing protein [Bacteroidales bacterium]|nr:methyltransferase domain-containing protein [Bacteroidales bacterium]
MADLPGYLYRFFNSRKGLFYLIVLFLCAGIGWMASRISFSEDIAGHGNASENPRDPTTLLRRMKIADRLVILISLRDSLAPSDPEALAECGARLADSLRTRFDSTLVRSVTFRSSDNVMSLLTQVVMDHLPGFLEEADYSRIDSLCKPEIIRKSMENNYRLLISPAGMMVKQRIRQDPLGITGRAFEKLQSLNAGGSYEIVDGCIYSADLRHLFLFVVPARPSSETAVNDRLISGLDKTIEQIEAGGKGFRILYFGGTAVAVSNARQLKKDITWTLVLALGAIFLLIGWYFRNLRVPLLGMLPALFGGTLALALIWLARGSLSIIALGIGSVILGLIIDYTLYIINHYRKLRSAPATLKAMSLTILLCCLTTSGAFLCLTFLNSAVLRDLGWFAAISVAGAAFFTLFILPQFLTLSLAKPGRADRITLVDRIAGYRYETKGWLIAVLALLIILGVCFAGKAGFESDMTTLSFVTPTLKSAETELDRTSDYKLKSLYLVATGRSREEALRMREKYTRTIDRLIACGVVRHQSNAGPLLLSDSLQQVRNARWKQFWSPEKIRQVKEAVAFHARRLGFKPGAMDAFGQLLDRKFSLLTPGDLPSDIRPLVTDWLTETRGFTSASAILKVPAAQRQEVYRAFGHAPGIVLFDRQTLTEQFVAGVKSDFDKLVMLSMAFVTLLLIVSFGRLGLGLITAAPMFLGWIMTLGFMDITGIRFNIFNIIISSFIFGLGVDYSILIMRGLQHSLRTGADEMQAYKVSVLLSSLTTLLGVGALFATRHPALHSIALVSVFGISAVVLLSFTLQPFLFNRFMLERQQRGKFPVTLWILIKTLVTWGNIVLIAIILMILGGMINLLFPLRRKTKEMLFHRLFNLLTRAYIAFTFFNDRKLINEPGEDFHRPAIIISNHQSLIETPAFLRLYPRMIILTSSWVYRSPVFGPIARLASFFNIDEGVEAIAGRMKEKLEEGFSILVFPEGHRSSDQHIQRFHRGAFYLAEKTQTDILPMLVFGTGDFLAKGEFWGKPNSLRMKILPRVRYDDPSFGNTYQERARHFRQFYIREYRKFREEEGTAGYYRRAVALNYVLKGPVLEWYMRVKMRLEDNYQIYSSEMPVAGNILDLGCGFGFISYILMMTSDERQITGVDYDPDKIAVAKNGYARNDRIRFECADITQYPFTPQAGFVLGDVLHYLAPADQQNLLKRCFANLEPGGCILIREADASAVDRHKRSALTEFFSTKSGFNKTANDKGRLFFTSAEQIRSLAEEAGLRFTVRDTTNVTSNKLFILRK